ncbi:hypothetical protein B0J13DRAFT_662736 [Dactylonectria estremocensis]|uniref:Uncharacterized protein n=1 Tax=Dactylonectria estremocensis TaxID=1079267 RepID=A0A9P9EZB1_9HYPO|nr:hypothetical protein B0J13DRAFT_662736 [Dactylonectria estremocensis]
MEPSRITPISSPSEERPEWLFTQSIRTGSLLYVGIKDYFHISTWLCIGSIFQAAATLAFGPRALIPSITLLVLRTLDLVFQSLGVSKNRCMDGAIRKKWSAQIPHADGTFGPKAADEGLVIFFVGGQVNHPLGPLAPGSADTQKLFEGIVKELDNYYDKNGLLGYTEWQGTTEHSGNMKMAIMYWKDVESLHRFAHGPAHMAGLRWWTDTGAKKYPHQSVFHETFIIPPGGNYENVYLNCKPFGMGAITVPITKNADGTDREPDGFSWQRPIVDAKKGQLRTFARRVGRQDLTAHEKDDDDIWDRTVVEP